MAARDARPSDALVASRKRLRRKRETAGHPLLALQGTAGNRAVAQLVALQREPAATETAAPTADEIALPLLADAEASLAGGAVDGPAYDHFTDSAGTVASVVNALWVDELTLVDVDPAGKGLKPVNARKVQAFRKRLEAQVGKAVNKKLAELQATVKTSTTQITSQVEGFLREAPMWGEGAVADKLFRAWVGPVPITGSSPAGASALWTALRNASGPIVAAKRHDGLTKASVGALDAAELAAVRTTLDPSTTWVVTESDTDQLTDQVAGALSRPVAHTDAAWRDLRSRMSTLVLAAECDLINATVPQSKRLPLVPESWANFRNRYVATLTKPMWTFYRDNIVDGNILGSDVKASVDSSGVHRDVRDALPLLEESAMRLGGFASRAELIKANQSPGSEFRFEAMSHQEWMGRARHLSFHGTGRAMDFRYRTNKDFGGEAHELVSILGGDELSELAAGGTAQRVELSKIAGHLAEVRKFRGELATQLAAATDDDVRTDLQSKLQRIDDYLSTASADDAQVVEVRDRVTEAHRRIKAIEAQLVTTWAKVQVTDAKGNTSTDIDQVKALVDAAAAQAKADLDAATAAKADTVGVLTERVRRIAEVQALMNDPKARGKSSGQTQASMLATAGGVAAAGITDMPVWMVQAFAERGWQWGEWAGFSDAMHFDYMGPVSDVRSDAQYL